MAAFVGAFALFATPAEAGGGDVTRTTTTVIATVAGAIAVATGITTEDGTEDMDTIARCVTIGPHTIFRHPVFQIGFGFGGGGYCR